MTPDSDSMQNTDAFQKQQSSYSRKKHLIPPRLESFINHVLINDEMPIENRFDLLALGITTCISVIGIIYYLIRGNCIPEVILFAVLFVISEISLFLYVFKGWKKRSYIIHTVCNSLIFLPLYFYLIGGIAAAAFPLLILGLVWPLCFTTGKKAIVIFLCSLLLYLSLIILNIFYPDIFPNSYQGASGILLNIIWAFIVAIIISIILITKSKLYEKQRKHIEAHEFEMKTVMQSLQKADRAKTKFLATMSHEIRTPMNSIIGMNQLILRETTDKKIRNYAAVIDRDSKGLLSIINEILDLSRISGEERKILHKSYNLRDVLMHCCSQMYPLILEKKLECYPKIDPDTPSNLIGDPLRIQQIIINLLSNAIKYTKEGSITFSLGYTTTHPSSINLIISVSDTGIGIAEENIPQIFSPFQRIEYAEEYIQGTGLGLSITKEIVDGMGGSITVDSTLGVGTTFTVTIPQDISGEEKLGVINHQSIQVNDIRTEEQKAYSPLFISPSLKILVVDDVPSNILVFKSLLRETKAQIDSALSGAECLRRVTESNYDIIFLDVMLPNMTGTETLQKFRKLLGNKSEHAPIIALTADALVGSREEYLRQGFADYLAKPIDGTDLEEMIQKHVSKVCSTEVVPQSESEESNVSNPPELEKFSDIDGLSLNLGLSYCNHDSTVYYEVLHLFAYENYLEQIFKSFASAAWSDYRISMHTLKSAALTIGAEQLSELAKKLESAAMMNNTPYILENHNQVYSMYSELIDRLKKAFED